MSQKSRLHQVAFPSVTPVHPPPARLLTHCPVCLKLLEQGQQCVCCASPVVVTDNGFTANVIEGDHY